MREDKYILDEQGNPVPEPDTLKWAEWMGTTSRHVADETINDKFRVSTVFLGLDYSFGGDEPVLYETMVFSPGYQALDGYTRRYTTREQAEQGHRELVDEIKQRLKSKLV
ncbi:MAG: hypothetical protein WC822_06480 [Candidatus Paceibacterota bacterium]|jgi:hypothetical protein